MRPYGYWNPDRRPRFMTNIKQGRAMYIREAAILTDFDIEVRQEATDSYGQEMPGDVSVWTNEPCGTEHEPFWEMYDKLLRFFGERR